MKFKFDANGLIEGKYTFAMPKAALAKWLNGLRNKGYKQGRGMLGCDSTGYCCLGVLEKELDGFVRCPDASRSSQDFFERHGIETGPYEKCNPMLVFGTTRFSAIAANDAKNKNFAQIADAIERSCKAY